jgi:hypothetical protein
LETIRCTTRASATALAKIDNVRRLVATETGGALGAEMTTVSSSPFLKVMLANEYGYGFG